MRVQMFILAAAFAVLAASEDTSAQARATLACRSGQLYINGVRQSNSEICGTHAGYDSVGLAIDVPQSSYVSEPNPPCDREDSDALRRLLAQLATAVMGGDSGDVRQTGRAFDQMAAQCMDMGGEAGRYCRQALGLADRSSCQPFVVHAPKVDFVTAWGSDNQAGTDAFCADFRNDSSSPLPGSVECKMGHAGWEQFSIRPTDRGNVVGALFKNWSGTRNINRTGTLWVWWKP